MQSWVRNIFVVLCALGIGSTVAQVCPCTLLSSTRYPGTYKWDCYNLGLTVVPGQCYDLQARNVTEYDLGLNKLTEVSTIDLFGLFDLKLLTVDSNLLAYFDPTALDGVNGLEIFYAADNLNMEIPSPALRQKPELRIISFVGSQILVIPNILASTKMEYLDCRSCALTTLTRPTFGTLTSSTFYLNLIGNSIVDVAADILLPIPSGATINVDSYFTIWAKDNMERDAVLSKQWIMNIDIFVSLRICGTDGMPSDASMC